MDDKDRVTIGRRGREKATVRRHKEMRVSSLSLQTSRCCATTSGGIKKRAEAPVYLTRNETEATIT